MPLADGDQLRPTNQPVPTSPQAQAAAIEPDSGQHVNAMQVLAYVIAVALLASLTRDQLVAYAARHDIALALEWTDAQILTAIREHHAKEARQDGLPIDDLPILTGRQGRGLGRILAGGEPPTPDTAGEPD